MPQLDVSYLLLDPDFAERFIVFRRKETVSNFGKSTLTSTQMRGIGVIQPASDNKLERGADEQHATKSITIVTKFRLQQPTPGYQPDIVLYHGNHFVITRAEDYSGYGSGFIQAEADSIDYVDDAAPATPTSFWSLDFSNSENAAYTGIM